MNKEDNSSFIIIQSHTFVAENCAIDNMVKKIGRTV